MIKYLSPRDPTRYEVRVYDLNAGRLLRNPVVDPNESADEMRGFPLTRTASSDGRWAYTLYDGNGEHPFVHALDTTSRKARCIDLDSLAGLDLTNAGLNLGAGGKTLRSDSGQDPVAVVDTRTFEVREPVAAGVAEAPAVSETRGRVGAHRGHSSGPAAACCSWPWEHWLWPAGGDESSLLPSHWQTAGGTCPASRA